MLKGEAKKEYQKDLMRKRRSNKDGSNTVGLTDEVTTTELNPETVPASYVMGVNRKYKTLPVRPRYHTLSDGQELDRTKLPEPRHDFGDSMRHCNESAYGFKPLRKH